MLRFCSQHHLNNGNARVNHPVGLKMPNISSASGCKSMDQIPYRCPFRRAITAPKKESSGGVVQKHGKVSLPCKEHKKEYPDVK